MNRKGLNIEVTKEGNLSITLTTEGKEYLEDEIENTELPASENISFETITWKRTPMEMWCELIEQFAVNGSYAIAPDNIFALFTASPIICSEQIVPDDYGNNWEIPQGTKFWYFPQYMTTDELELMYNGETVIFLPVEYEYNSGKKIKEVSNPILGYWYAILSDNADIDANNIAMAENAVKAFSSTKSERYLLHGYTKAQVIAEYARRQEIIGTPLSTAQQLAFIAEHNTENLQHDIEKVYKQSFDKALTAMIPCVYFSNGRANIITSFEVNYNKALQHNAGQYEKMVLDLKIRMEDFIPYCSHYILFSEHFKRVDNKQDQFSYHKANNIYLIHFLQYLVTGELRDTFKETNELMDAQKISYNLGAWELYLGNLKIKRFMNGRIDIKGLNDQQQKCIDKMLEVHDKVRNR